MKYWYVVLVMEPPGGTRARVMHTYRRIMHMQYKTGRMSEYRACRGFVEALVLALIYNHEWAARIYRKGRWYGQ